MTHSPYGDFEQVSVALCRMETDQGGYFLHSRGFRGSREIGERILRLTTDEDYEWAARRMDARALVRSSPIGRLRTAGG